jgi:hypothetical protein
MNEISFGFDKGVVGHLEIDGTDLIEPWGVEFADSSSFFSLEEGFGYRYRMLERTETRGDESRDLWMRLELKEGLVELSLREWKEGPQCIRRRVELVCLRDSYLMDFVLRYRFKRSVFKSGDIAGRQMEYDGTNVYHQHPVDIVSLHGSTVSADVSVVESRASGLMRPLMYLRSGENSWVIHARMFPEPGAAGKYVIKLCSKWFQTRPIPAFLTQLLLRCPRIQEALWYRGEHRPYRNRIARIFSPNAFFMAFLPAGTRLMWDVRCTIRE